MIAASSLALNTASVFAADDNSFTVYQTSNLFPDKTAFYKDVNTLKDENGDIYITVDYDIFAVNKMIVNFQMNKIEWDPDVLSFETVKNSVNADGTDILNIHPILTEQGYGSAPVINTMFSEDGKVVSNYSNISSANRALAYSYDDSGNPVPGTLIRVVFKVIDPTVAETTVNLDMCMLSLDDEDSNQPNSKYRVIDWNEVNSVYLEAANLNTRISPEEEGSAEPSAKIGDVNFDGIIDIFDASAVQKYSVDKLSLTEEQLYVADVNDDEEINVLDALDIQKFTVDKITEFEKK